MLTTVAPNAEYATETREELLYNKEKLLANGWYSIPCKQTLTLQGTNGNQRLLHVQEQTHPIDRVFTMLN
jgi:hypothetical protein